ncbi:restriction endonuclease subunit S [Saccharothrix sp. HUAS TT1]|uniref:restriction endonuclease subunit S n=1 Tax=unclassified Saccharothrix TaxID=2593673 RepID=UPI00345BBFC2
MSDLPLGWEWVRLGEVGTWFGGGTPSKGKPEYWLDGTIPWLSPKDMGSEVLVSTRDKISELALGNSPARLVPQNSVAIVVRSGILERRLPVAVVPFGTTLNQDMRAVVPFSGIAPAWIAYYLRSVESQLLKECTKRGTTVASIDVPSLMNVSIPVAPEAEQNRIMAQLEDHLSRLDAAMKGVERGRSRLRNVRLSAMRKMLQGVGIPSGVDMGTANDVLATAQGGGAGEEVVGPWPIPDSWRWSTMGRLFRVYVGATPSRSVASNWNGSIPWVSSGEVSFCRIGSTRETISEEALGNRDTRYHPPGTVLLAMIGEGKTRGQAAVLDIGAAHNQNCASIRVSETAMLPEYVYTVLEERYHETRLLSSGGNQLALNSSRVREIPIPVPPLGLQRYIVEKVSELSRMEERLAADLRIAVARGSQLRRSLLIDAFAGRLTSQNTSDEPASVLLERLQKERVASQSTSKRGRRENGTTRETLL